MEDYQLSILNYQLRASDLSGGYCSGVPPLPIPNREVKPACADGTAMQCGRVGGRLLFKEKSPGSAMTWGFFRYYASDNLVKLKKYQNWGSHCEWGTLIN